MKSSSISLLFRPKQPAAFEAKCPEYLVNLIDSPGHVDFCSEVRILSLCGTYKHYNWFVA